MAGLADVVDAQVVFVGFKYLIQAVAEGDEFFVVEEAFEDAELGPLSKAAEYFVDFGAAFVVGYVVGDEVHGR